MELRQYGRSSYLAIRRSSDLSDPTGLSPLLGPSPPSERSIVKPFLMWTSLKHAIPSQLQKRQWHCDFKATFCKSPDVVPIIEAKLTGNTSYGVSRVYSQQCLYVLTDAQAAQSNMRALLRTVKTSELDPDAGKARFAKTSIIFVYD